MLHSKSSARLACDAFISAPISSRRPASRMFAARITRSVSVNTCRARFKTSSGRFGSSAIRVGPWPSKSASSAFCMTPRMLAVSFRSAPSCAGAAAASFPTRSAAFHSGSARTTSPRIVTPSIFSARPRIRAASEHSTTRRLYSARTVPDLSAICRLSATTRAAFAGILIARTRSGSNSMNSAWSRRPKIEAA